MKEKVVGKLAIKFKTWIQVATAGILGIIQLAQISLKPEIAWYGGFSIVILAILIFAIIYSDFKTSMVENELKKVESKALRQYEALRNEVPTIEWIAQNKGANMALQDVAESFREDAKSARSNRTKKIYLEARKLVSRQQRLLQKMQEIAKD